MGQPGTQETSREEPAPEKPAAEKAAAPEKPAAEKAKDSPKKKGLDALQGEEKAVEAEAEVEATAVEEEIDTSKWAKTQRDAFATARVKEKRLNETIRDTQIRVEKLQQELEEAKANPKDSEATIKELAELRRWHSAQEVEQSDEWKASIRAPYDEVMGKLHKIATRAGISPEALEKATDIEDELDRMEAIRDLLGSGDNAIPAEYINKAVLEADKLPALYARADSIRKNAHEALSSLQHQTVQQKESAAKEAEAEYVKHHDHIYGQLAAKLPSMFKNEEMASLVKSARPATDPADRAYQSQAAEILPYVTAEMISLRSQVGELTRSNQALLGTRAGVKPSPVASKPAQSDGVEMDEGGLMDAIRTVRG